MFKIINEYFAVFNWHLVLLTTIICEFEGSGESFYPWLQRSNSTNEYKFLSAGGTWDESQEKCRAEGGDLVSLNDQAELVSNRHALLFNFHQCNLKKDQFRVGYSHIIMCDSIRTPLSKYTSMLHLLMKTNGKPGLMEIQLTEHLRKTLAVRNNFINFPIDNF